MRLHSAWSRRKICDKYGVLLIADEVITAFGRTGKMFAMEHWNVQPDILSIAKAITSGYIPMGAFIVSKQIADALQDLPPDARFMHAYTNSAHPTASAVGLRNLRIIDLRFFGDTGPDKDDLGPRAVGPLDHPSHGQCEGRVEDGGKAKLVLRKMEAKGGQNGKKEVTFQFSQSFIVKTPKTR